MRESVYLHITFIPKKFLDRGLKKFQDNNKFIMMNFKAKGGQFIKPMT